MQRKFSLRVKPETTLYQRHLGLRNGSLKLHFYFNKRHTQTLLEHFELKLTSLKNLFNRVFGVSRKCV